MKYEELSERLSSRFENVSWTKDTDYNRIKNFNNTLRDLEIADINSRIKTREQLKSFFLRLLVVQSIFAGTLVWDAYFAGKLSELSLIFGVLISGTMAESVLVLKIIVEKTFGNIRYKYHKGKEV